MTQEGKTDDMGRRGRPVAQWLTKKQIMTHEYAVMPLYALRHPSISNGAKSLFAEILSRYYYPEDVRCWPSEATISADLSASTRTIRRWRDELEKVGLLGHQSRADKRNSNEYFIPPPPEEAVANIQAQKGRRRRRGELASGEASSAPTDRHDCDDNIGRTGHFRPEVTDSPVRDSGQNCPQVADKTAVGIRIRKQNVNKKRTLSKRVHGDDVLKTQRTQRAGRTASRQPKVYDRSPELAEYLREHRLYELFLAEQEAARNLTDDAVASYAQEACLKKNPGGFFRHQLNHQDHAFDEYSRSPLEARRDKAEREEREHREASFLASLKDKLTAAERWPGIVAQSVREQVKGHGSSLSEQDKSAFQQDTRLRAVKCSLPGGFDKRGRYVVVVAPVYSGVRMNIRHGFTLAFKSLGIRHWHFHEETDLAAR